MPSNPPGGEPAPRAHCFRLTRRHFLGAAAALAISSALPAGAHATPIVDFVGSPDSVGLAGDPSDDQMLDWPPPPPPSDIVLVPYRSQLDGSPQARANCGPACLAMMLALYGDGTSIADIRHSVDQYMGVWWVGNGSTWEALASAAASRGYGVLDLSAGRGKYRQWSFGDLMTRTRAGSPVMILVRYRALPGRESSYFYGNHYIVIVGVDDEGAIVYHDPAFPDAAAGAYLRMSRPQLANAWSTVTSGIQFTGMTIQPKKQ